MSDRAIADAVGAAGLVGVESRVKMDGTAIVTNFVLDAAQKRAAAALGATSWTLQYAMADGVRVIDR